MHLAACKCGTSWRWLVTSRPWTCDDCRNRTAMKELARRDVILAADIMTSWEEA